MTDKDPKDMTVSEQLRWAANGEPYNGIDENIWTYPTGKIRALAEAVTGEWPSDNEIFSIVADKIDAELAQARRSGLERAAKSWAKANGWPDFREGEDFGAWLDRCAIPRPRFEDGEVVAFGEYEDILGYCVYDDGEFSLTTPDRSIDFAQGERVKRPAPEVLLGDGNPVSNGDTVYVIESGIERTVKDFGTRRCDGMDGWDGSPWVMFDNGSWMHARDLTHTPPDTQQKIDDDALKTFQEYWKCVANVCEECPSMIGGKKPTDYYECAGCLEAQKLDLLRRQRELDKQTGGDA